MTVTLDLPPEKEAALKAQAQARGLSLEQWMLELADQSVGERRLRDHQRDGAEDAGGHHGADDVALPEEWARQFDAWVDSHNPDTPALSDEAMSRESIYPDLI